MCLPMCMCCVCPSHSSLSPSPKHACYFMLLCHLACCLCALCMCQHVQRQAAAYMCPPPTSYSLFFCLRRRTPISLLRNRTGTWHVAAGWDSGRRRRREGGEDLGGKKSKTRRGQTLGGMALAWRTRAQREGRRRHWCTSASLSEIGSEAPCLPACFPLLVVLQLLCRACYTPHYTCLGIYECARHTPVSKTAGVISFMRREGRQGVAARHQGAHGMRFSIALLHYLFAARNPNLLSFLPHAARAHLSSIFFFFMPYG